MLPSSDNSYCILQQEGQGSAGQSAGVKRPLEDLTLLENPEEPLNEPWTQEAPVTTEDMLLETEAAISALGETCDADGCSQGVQKHSSKNCLTCSGRNSPCWPPMMH